MDWTKLLGLRRVMNVRHLTPWGRVQMILRLPSIIRLSLALFRDARVPLMTKALTVGGLVLIFSPIDLPEFIPVAGQIWDLALVAFALELFIENAPKEVVSEHVARLGLQGKFKV